MKEKVVFILGLKWFDKTYGNTYCRPVVITDRGNTLTMDYKYGYGTQYLEYAKQVCDLNGIDYESVPHTEKWVKKAEIKNINYL